MICLAVIHAKKKNFLKTPNLFFKDLHRNSVYLVNFVSFELTIFNIGEVN